MKACIAIVVLLIISCTHDVKEIEICSSDCVTLINQYGGNVEFRINQGNRFVLENNDSVYFDKQDTLYHYISKESRYILHDTTMSTGRIVVKIEPYFDIFVVNVGFGIPFENKFISIDSTFCTRKSMESYSASYDAKLELDKDGWNDDIVEQKITDGIVEEKTKDSTYKYEMIEVCPVDSLFDAYAFFGKLSWVVACSPEIRSDFTGYLSGLGTVANMEWPDSGLRGYYLMNFELQNDFLLVVDDYKISNLSFQRSSWDYGCTGY